MGVDVAVGVTVGKLRVEVRLGVGLNVAVLDPVGSTCSVILTVDGVFMHPAIKLMLIRREKIFSEYLINAPTTLVYLGTSTLPNTRWMTASASNPSISASGFRRIR